MAVLAVYLAGFVDYRDVLARGEKGIVLLIAPDMKQAKVSLDYAEGALRASPLTEQLIASRTADRLELTTGIALEVRSASFRRIRGVTCVAVLADECAFWMSDESANPDVEILNAARPALATTQGALIGGLVDGVRGFGIGAGIGAGAALGLIQFATNAPAVFLPRGTEFIVWVD